MTKIQKWLFDHQDEKYRAFHSKLIPNVDKSRIIGVRIPHLRKYSKSISDEEKNIFFDELPHFYYEENNIHAFLIENIKDYDRVIFELERFLPFVDNWATCDSMRPRVLGKYPEKTLEKALEWIESELEYTVRFGIEVLMIYFLGNNFDKDIIKKVALIDRKEYYIKMMCSWFFATAMIDHFDEVINYFDIIDQQTKYKTISKALESFRISDEKKIYLKNYKKSGDNND